MVFFWVLTMLSRCFWFVFFSSVYLLFLPVVTYGRVAILVALISRVSLESLLSYGPLRFMVCFLGPLGTPFGPLQQGGMQRERLLFARELREFSYR